MMTQSEFLEMNPLCPPCFSEECLAVLCGRGQRTQNLKPTAKSNNLLPSAPGRGVG